MDEVFEAVFSAEIELSQISREIAEVIHNGLAIGHTLLVEQ